VSDSRLNMMAFLLLGSYLLFSDLLRDHKAADETHLLKLTI
jgi:hypothetical protein